MVEYQPQVISDLGQAIRDHGGYVSYEPLAQKIDYFASKNTINRYLVSMEGFKKQLC